MSALAVNLSVRRPWSVVNVTLTSFTARMCFAGHVSTALPGAFPLCSIGSTLPPAFL